MLVSMRSVSYISRLPLRAPLQRVTRLPHVYDHRPVPRVPLEPVRSFWSRRKVDPGFSYCFVDEIVNHWDIDWIFPTLRSTLKQYCIDLGIWDEENSCIQYRWHVESTRPDELPSLPKRLPHAGDYQWIGEPSTAAPKWLWDSKTGKTVPATESRLREGFMAISYTWGRWCIKNEWRAIEGVPWQVPAVKSEGCDITELLPILKSFPNTRYFWIDVLCINQKDPVEKQQEISKQGSIFAQAKGVLIYLWTIPSGHKLALGLCHLGDSVLWSMKISPKGDLWRLKNNASYRGRRYATGGPKEERSVTPFAWAIQADPWFTSLWTMQEMILCPSGILMAKNGDVCTVNNKAVTVAFLATAITMVEQMTDLRQLLPDIDSFLPKAKRWIARIAIEKLDKSGQMGPQFTRLLDAMAELRNRREKNFIIHSRCGIWNKWKDTVCLDTCLTANRCDILSAVTKRQASGRRGEAVLAALKVAPFDGAFDANGVTASGLPAPLLNKVLQSEGRALFININDGLGAYGDNFFSHVTPQPTDTRNRDTITLGRGSQAYEPLPEKDWYIKPDETLHIPCGSHLQVPDSRKVYIGLNSNAGSETIWDMSKAPEMIRSRFRKWRMRQLRRNTLWRAFGLDLVDDGPPNPYEDPQALRDIQVRFVPLAYMKEPEDTKKLTAEARHDPFQTMAFKFWNLNTEVDDRVMGIILASDTRDDAQAFGPRKWYKCGDYISFGEYKPFPVPEEEGMTVGML